MSYQYEGLLGDALHDSVEHLQQGTLGRPLNVRSVAANCHIEDCPHLHDNVKLAA